MFPVTRVSSHLSPITRRYEDSILALEELTLHQEQKLAECKRAGEQADVLIKAAAGTGKTFVALHFMLKTLEEERARVLFVARSPALCFFVIKWLARCASNSGYIDFPAFLM